MKLIDGEKPTIPVSVTYTTPRKRGRGVAVVTESHPLTQEQVAHLVDLPADQLATEEAWAAHGLMLGHAERVLGWAVGAWWNAGEKFGRRVDIVTAATWTGPSHKTCRNYGAVVAQTPLSRRRGNLSFAHHEAVASLPTAEADAILAEASETAASTGKAPPVNQIRQIVKRRRREQREEDLAVNTTRASEKLGTKLYGVIYADPPWRFEPRSRDSGLDRAADNHYPTMGKAELEALRPPAAPDCVLFMWATAPMLEHALDLMRHWGFAYRSHLIWQKDRLGTGYWARNMHELLLIGVKGEVPAPAMGSQPGSVLAGAVRRHSQKPERFAELIEAMFPHQAKIEMFARTARKGWDSFGNEIGDAPDPNGDGAEKT